MLGDNKEVFDAEVFALLRAVGSSITDNRQGKHIQFFRMPRPQFPGSPTMSVVQPRPSPGDFWYRSLSSTSVAISSLSGRPHLTQGWRAMSRQIGRPRQQLRTGRVP